MKKQQLLICGHCENRFEDKKQYYYKKDIIVTCPECGYENSRDNFGPTAEKMLHLTCMTDMLNRAKQATKEGEDCTLYKDQTRNQLEKLKDCLLDD